MRITRLYMKGFIAIYLTQGKKEIEIIFPKDKMINILYGGMGTGKTFILGHCQPWHTFGVLDVRNGDEQIMAGENGKKENEYEKGNNHYIVTHDYIWNGKTHITKHFFKKNGEELNPNGNLSTFNDIVKLEFGIDQEYLRLLRIGDNVTNIIKLKSTERKKYVASRLEEAEMYLMLYKKISQDLRLINSKVEMLNKNLASMQYNKLDEMKDNYNDMSERLLKLMEESSSTEKEYYKLEGRIQEMLENSSYEQYVSKTDEIIKLVEMKTLEANQLLDTISEMENLYEPEKIKQEINRLDGYLHAITQHMHENVALRDSVIKEINKITDKLALIGNAEQKNVLIREYSELSNKIDSMEKETAKYHYTESFYSLSVIKNEAEQINFLLYSLASYRFEDVSRIFLSDNSVLKWAKNMINNLQTKQRIERSKANNYRFSMEYIPSSPLFIPPFCPTEDCPYRKQHPATLRSDNKQKEIENIVKKYMDEVNGLDIEIARFEDYPTIYSIIEKLRAMWHKNEKIMDKLGLLKQKQLTTILSKNGDWFNSERLVYLMELSQKKDELIRLRERMISIKDEINQLELNETDELEKRLKQLKIQDAELIEKIEDINLNIIQTEGSIKDYNDKYLKVSKLSIMQDEYSKLQTEVSNMDGIIESRVKIQENAKEYLCILTEKKKKILCAKEEYTTIASKCSHLKDWINRANQTIEEYKDTLDEQRLYSRIVEAVSPKNGIPIYIVEIYLNQCRDAINSLISDIFDDRLEIEKFDINDNDFLIPYNVGGRSIEDVSRASQGEKSIIGIAISFAMMQNSNVSYNIPLLDEPDAALHSSDRNKFVSLLFKWIRQNSVEQVILITHNQTFEGYPINLILTSDEAFEENELQSVYRL